MAKCQSQFGTRGWVSTPARYKIQPPRTTCCPLMDGEFISCRCAWTKFVSKKAEWSCVCSKSRMAVPPRRRDQNELRLKYQHFGGSYSTVTESFNTFNTFDSLIAT